MEELSGPMGDTFLEIYMDYHYLAAKKLQSRARALGLSLDALTVMARAGVGTIEFEITLMEEKHNEK